MVAGRGVATLKGHARKQKHTVGADLDYTLRAFPNHHGALDSMGRYQLEKGRHAPGARRTADCYFERALRFAPHNAVARMLYGIYLVRKGKPEQALLRYQEALELAPNSSELHYNMGLLYTDLKRYDDALRHAHRAYVLGFPLPGPQRKLARAGQWRDSPPEINASAGEAEEDTAH